MAGTTKKSTAKKQPTQPQPQPFNQLPKRILFWVMVAIGSAGLSYQLSQALPYPAQADSLQKAVKADIVHDFTQLNLKIRTLEDKQAQYGVKVVDDQAIQQEISDITFNQEINNLSHARKALLQLTNDVKKWDKDLELAILRKSDKNPVQAASPEGINVPILIYHYTPTNFEEQLQYLVQHHYSAVTFDQLVDTLTKGALMPAKPVIITFDDGYEDQMKAFGLLKKYDMPATYYIIVGGPDSAWCIGAGRSNSACGDAYLSWGQVRMLDASGLITIASHTLNHLNLASLPPERQRLEIFEGKAQLESQLGHPVRHFAYPYGSYNGTTMQLVREAGFATAVSTLPGTFQGPSNLYSLYRVRSALTLP